jgi:hypothetical protein
MKRSKKLAATILTALMAVSLAITPAFADEGETTAESGTSQEGTSGSGSSTSGDDLAIKETGTEGISKLPVTKYLTADAGAVCPDVTFYFTMKSASVAEGTTINNLEVVSGSFKSGTPTYTDAKTPMIFASVTMNSKTSVDEYDASEKAFIVESSSSQAFDLINNLPISEMNPGKVYRYQVDEITIKQATDYGVLRSTSERDPGNITYNTTSATYTVDVYVAQSGTNKRISTIIVRNKSNDKSNLVFKNSLESHTLLISKSLAGNNTNADDEFTFWIKIPEGGDAIDLSADASFTAVKTDTSGDTTELQIKVKGDKFDYNNWTTESADLAAKGWNKFTLKAGETLAIQGLPLNMIFYIYEEDTGLGYASNYAHITETNTLNENTVYAEGNPKNYFTITTGTNQVAYKNVRNVPDTGIRMDVIPYVIVFLGVVVCVAGLVVNKRRHTR